MTPASGRVLALDPGGRRVGVAVSDPLGHTAQPLDTLDGSRPAELIDRVSRLCREYEVTEVVVGLPLNMDGSAGPEAERARELARRLRDALHLPVIEWDERLSTVAAERLLVGADLSRARRRQVRDRVAAALILQAYLDRRRRGSPPNGGLSGGGHCC